MTSRLIASAAVIVALASACSSGGDDSGGGEARRRTSTTMSAPSTTGAVPDTPLCRVGVAYVAWRDPVAKRAADAEPRQLAEIFSESADWLGRLADVVSDPQLAGRLRASADVRREIAGELSGAKTNDEARAVLNDQGRDADLVNAPAEEVDELLETDCGLPLAPTGADGN